MSSEKKPEYVREQPMTYDDYAALPDDGNRYELADGVLELMGPAPSPKHQLISSQLQKKLLDSCEQEFIVMYSPLDVILSPIEVSQPDLVMIHRSRLSIVTRRGVEGSPDLVVEILSPSTRKRDKVAKSKAYAQYKVPEYWIVDPSSATLEQYVLDGERYELAEVYAGDEQVSSERVRCASFSMNDIMRAIPELPD